MKPEIEKLVEDLMPQARSEAWRRWQRAPQQLDRGELESLACLGLVMAGARWEAYCAERGYSPGATQYFAAYALRRMKGAIVDYLRSVDWVTRSGRANARALQEAGQESGATEAELRERTGLSSRQIRDTMAAVARRPVSMDAEPVDVASDSDDVEGQAVVDSVLEAAVGALRAQPRLVQAVMALRYHQGRELKDIAVVLGCPESEVGDLHTAGILAVHAAMVAAVDDSPPQECA